MFKAIKDDKIIAISEKKEVKVTYDNVSKTLSYNPKDHFPCLVYDEVVEDTEHTVKDYEHYQGEFLLKSDIPAPTKEEVAERRRSLYIEQKDPLTCQIQALRDEEQTDEIIAEIESLKVKRAEVVAKIKEENPYPTETKASEVIHDSQMEQLELPLYV